MHEDQWADLKDTIADRFTVTEQGKEPLEGVPNGQVDFVVFDGPVGTVRLERVTKPRTIGERAMATRRIGSTAEVETLYDESDMVAFLKAFRWNEQRSEWEEIRPDAFTQ